MAILGFWGFASGERRAAQHGWIEVPYSDIYFPYVTAQSALDNGYGLYLTLPSGASAKVPGTFSLATAYLAFDLYYTAGIGTYDRCIMRFLNSTGQNLFALNQVTARNLRVIAGSIDANSSGTYALSTKHKIRIKYTPSDTNGEIKLWVGTDLVFDYTGVDTASNTVGNVTGVVFGDNSAFSSGNFWIGSVVLDDAAVPSAKWRIGKKVPNGAGYATNMNSLGGGSNWSEVDEIPPDPSKGVYDNSVSQLDAYALATLSGQVDTVQAVKAVASVEKQGQCTPANMRLGVRSSSADYFGSDEALDTYYRRLPQEKVWLTDPADSQPWTPTKVGGLQALIETRT